MAPSRGETKRRGLALAWVLSLLVLLPHAGILGTYAATLENPSEVYEAAYKAKNRKDRVKTDRLPTRADSSHFSGSTTFEGGRSDQVLSYDFSFIPFFGPAKGRTPVEVQVKGVFPTGIHTAFCHFGSKTTPVKIAQAKRHSSKVQTIKFTCHSPPGRAGRSVPVSVSVNELSFHEDTRGSQRFYYYSEPEVLEISPAVSDLQGGTLVTVYTSHDIFSEAFGEKSDDFYERNAVGRAALSNIKCSFDGNAAVGLRRRRCYERSCFVCISPASQDVGKVEVGVTPNGVNRLWDKGHFTYEDLNYEPYTVITGPALGHLYQGEHMYGIEDPGVFYELEYPGSRYVPGVFYDENMYEFYETSLGRHEAQFCLSKITTNLGPVSGGTVVSLGGRGSITQGKEEFYCVFGSSDFVQATSVSYSFSEDMYVLQCAAPADAVGAVEVRVSLNGIEATSSGLTYTYHEALDVASITPATVPSAGGTSVEIGLTNHISGISSRSCVCRFQVSLSQKIDTQGSFDDSTQKVTCAAPGVATDLEDTAVEVSVSFNGVDFGLSRIMMTTGKTTAGYEETTTEKLGFYGLVEGLVDTLVPIPAVELVQPVTPSLSLSSTAPYGEDMCVHFTMNSLAILSGLELFRVTELPDLSEEVATTSFQPSFEMDVHEYTAVVDYEVHSLNCRGVGADTYSNIFVDSVIVPNLGVSDAIPLVVGQNEIQIEVHSSNGLYSNVYKVQVQRLAQRTAMDLDAITVTDIDGTAYALSPSFSSGALSYSIADTVPYHSPYLTVALAHEDRYGIVKASVAADKSDEVTLGDAVSLHSRNMNLGVGSNTITLISLAQDRTVSQTYAIAVSRAAASVDTTFKTLEIKTGRGTTEALSPAFSPSATTYSASVRYTDTFTIHLALNNDRASYEGPDGMVHEATGQYTASLPVGLSVLAFKVTGQDGVSTSTYVINLTRLPASTDARLGSIDTKACSSTTQGLVEPSFDKDVDTYTSKVFFECTASGESDAMGPQYISLNATCHDVLCSGIRMYEPKGDRWITATAGEFTTLELNGNPLTDVTNAILIEVTAEDAITSVSTKKTYTVNAIRQKKDNNANLLSLIVNNAATSGFPTSGVLHRNTGDDVLPAFDKTHHEYWMEVENEVSSVTITAQVESAFAILKVGVLSPASLSTVANNTESQALSLPSGTTTTLKVEVLSQRYQPNESVEGYDASTTTAGTDGTGSRIITHIHVFRRTKSTDASLSALAMDVDGPSTGVTTAFNPAFATGTTTGYAMTVRYYIGKLKITGTCPDTASPVSYKIHSPRCTTTVGAATSTSGNVIEHTLSSGVNTINVVVTAEDGTTTKTYTVTVTREVPQSDSKLQSLAISCSPLPSLVPPAYQTTMNASIAGCWLSKTAKGGDPAQAGYDAAFSADHLTYYVRSQHGYMYHGAAVSPDIQAIAFTAKVSSRVDDIPVSTMTLGSTALADSVQSAQMALLETPASSFPTPSTTTFVLTVTAEDGSQTVYTIHVVRGAVEPDASHWVKYYELNDYSNKTADVVAGTVMPFNLEVNANKWNAEVGAALSTLSNEFAPISAMDFQPVVTLNGSTSVTASTFSLSKGGLCGTGYSCIDYFCAADVGGAKTTTRCGKNIPVTFTPQGVGSYVYKVEAYSQFVQLLGASAVSQVGFNVIHAAMSLKNTKRVWPPTEGYVTQPGAEMLLLQAYDIFDNIILDTRLTYEPSQMEALVCPPDFIPQNTTWDPRAKAEPGFEGYCRCGPATGCSVPGRGTFTRNSNGTYSLDILTLTSGINNLYMTADFDGLPLNGGPGSDYHATYPVALAVSTNPIGTRSTLVFNTTIKPEVGAKNVTTLPYFHVVAYDQYSNKITKGGDVATISLDFVPALTSGYNLTDEENGKYKVVVNTTVAASYKVTLNINGAQSVGSPFTFQVYSGKFTNTSVADYPVQTLAGTKTQFLVYPKDSFGNAIEFGSPHGSVANRLKLEVKNLATNIKTVNEQEFVLQSDGTYLVNFTAPTNALDNYQLAVSFLNETHPQQTLFVLPPVTSNILDIRGSYPNPDKSLYYVRDKQKAGQVVLGVVGVDDYGNRSPHFWGKWSASLDLVATGAGDVGPVVAQTTSAIYDISAGGSVQVPFGLPVNVSGQYEVKFYYDGVVVDQSKILNSTTSVVPADIGQYSKLSKIPETTSLGQLVVVDIDAYDSYNNFISTGGEAGGMAIRIFKETDETDVVPHEVVDNLDGTYQAKFSPARSGVYIFEVRYLSDGRAFNQSFDVKFEFALPEHFEAVIPASLGAGVEATILIQPVEGVDLAAAAKSVIVAQLRASNGTVANLTMSSPDNDGRRTLKLVETKSGDYFLDVFLEGKHVGTSPYNLTIAPGPIATTNVKPMNQTTYYSDDTIEIHLDLYDQYDNFAQVDIANDISVKYYQLPEGLIVEADVAKTPVGYVASTKLTLSASYSVQIIVKGIKLCIGGEPACTPAVTILPGDVNALTSLLEGNGLGKTIVAGIQGSVRVVPLDTYSNLAQESKSQLMEYTLNVFASNSTQVGDPLKLAFSSLDSSHSTSYVLNTAGKYQMQVVQQDGAVVGGKMVEVEVLPSEVLVSNTVIDVGTPTVAVGSSGVIHVTLKDQFQNVMGTDLGKDLGVVLTNPSKVLSSALGDVTLSFAGGTYSAAFSTTVAGDYSVAIQVFGIGLTSDDTVSFVPEEPFPLTTIARLAGNGLGVAGEKNVIYINGKDKYGNARTLPGGNYTVDVSVPQGTSTKKLLDSEVSLSWKTEGATSFYQVEFVSEPKGIAYVEIKLDGAQVVGSPLSISVAPGSIDPVKSVLSGPGTTGGILNQETFFEIQSMDSFGNEIAVGGEKFEVTVKCTNQPCPSTSVQVKDLNDGRYDVRYALPSLGTFTLQVRLGMTDVGLLPLQSPLVVSSKNTAGNVNIMMSEVFGLSTVIEAGVQQTISVVALDAEGFQLTTGGEKFFASVYQTGLSLSTKVDFEATDYLNGTYVIQYERQLAGSYQLELKHKSPGNPPTFSFVGTKSLSYPIAVDCIPGTTSVENSYIVAPGIPAKAPAGAFQTVLVQSVDQFSNKQVHKDGVEDLWVITGSPVNTSLSLQVAYARKKSPTEGLYELSFKLPDIGLYNIDVGLRTLAGQIVSLSKAVVQGIPGGLAPSRVYILDTNKMDTVVSDSTTTTRVSFKPRDISGNIIPELSVAPSCAVNLEPAHTQQTSSCQYDPAQNIFNVDYSSAKSGLKSLSILLDGEHILGSPLGFAVDPGTPASAVATGIDFSGVQVNEKLSPTVTLADKFGNAIGSGDADISVEVVGGSSESFSGFVENFGNGTYRSRLQVQAAGAYNFLVISQGNASPLLNHTLQVDPLPTSAGRSYISPSSYFDGTKFRVSAGAVIESSVVAISEDGNQQQGDQDAFSVSISPDSAYLASVIDNTATSSASGKYSFRFTTKRVLAEGYLLDVTFGGKSIKGSPFPVQVAPGEPSAAQSNIYSGDYNYDESLGEFGSVAGVGRKFLLQLRDDYGNDLNQEAASSSGNKLAIQVDGAKNVSTSVVGLPDGRFEMFYSAQLAGNHLLQVQLSNQNVGGSSNVVVVAGANDFSKFNVYGPGITSDVVVGYTYHFNIEARDKFGNTRQDDGSTLGLLSVFMSSRNRDRETGSRMDKAFDLVQTKYEATASTSSSSEKWLAGSFRVMFKSTTSGQVHTTVSACPQPGMSCSHVESDLSNYDVQSKAVGASPYGGFGAKPQGMTTSVFSGVGLQGGVLASGSSSTEALPIVIEPLDKYGNVVELDESAAGLFAVTITPTTGMTASSVAALAGNQGFAFSLTASSVGNYFVDINYNGSVITSSGPLEVPVYSSYPPIDPAQCVDFGEIYETCVVGQTCTSSVQLYSEAKDPSCYTDQSTGKLMVLTSQRYDEIQSRPSACRGVFYPFSKTIGEDSYVTVLADSNKVNAIADDGKGTYTASMAFSISGLHTVETKVGPDLDSRWIQTVTIAIADGKTKVIKVFSSNTTDLNVASYPSVALSGQNVVLRIQPKDKFGNNQDYVSAIEDRIEVNYTSDTYLEYSSTLAKKRSTTSSIPFFYHEAVYVPRKPGVYSGQLYHGYSGVGGITPMSLPFSLAVLPGIPDSATSVVSGLGIYSTEVHQPGEVMVELRDQFSNKVGNSQSQKDLLPSAFSGLDVLSVAFAGSPASVTWQTLLEYDPVNEAFNSVYVASKTGVLNLKVHIMGKEVVLDSYVSTLATAGSISASSTTAEGPGVGQTGALSAGNKANFKVLAKDSYGNAIQSGGAVFKVVIQSVVLATDGINYVPDGKSTMSAVVIDNLDGSYSVDYTLQLASYYHVEVSRGSEGIAGSPFLVRVLPGPTHAASSVVYCEDGQTDCPLESLPVGKQGQFYIQAKDQFGGNKADFADQFFYSVVGGGLSKSSFATFRDILMPGQYMGSFFTNTAGPVELTVRLMGELVYSATIVVEPGQATVFNSEIVSPVFPSSTVHTSSQPVPQKVFVVTRDSFGNKLTTGGLKDDITLNFQLKNGDVIIPSTLVDEGDGTYSGSMTIKKAGQYIAKATLKGESLEKRDLLLKPASLVGANTLVYAQGGGSFIAGETCTILIQTLDEWYNVRYGGSDLDASVAVVELSLTSSENAVIYSGNAINKTFSENDGQYRITFVPELAGVVRLKLVLGGTEVVDQTTQRRWERQVLAGEPDAAKSVAYGTGIQKALSGVAASFNIKLSDKFDNLVIGPYLEKMSLEFGSVGSGPSLNAMSSTIVETFSKGIYRAAYTPPVHGEDYSIQVKLSLQTASGSAVEIQVSTVTVFKEAGAPFVVSFQLADALGVYVLPKEGEEPAQDWLQITAVPPVKSTSLKEVSPGFYQAEILSDEVGDYKLSFVAGGVALGESDGVAQPEYYLTVLPGWPSSAPQSKHSFYDTALTAGVPFSFVISAYDVFGNPQGNQSALYGSEGFGAALYPRDESMSTDASCKATDNFDGSYSVSCLSTVSGSYSMVIYLDLPGNERVLIGGTNNLTVAINPGQFSPSNSLVVPESTVVKAGEQYSVIIQGRDTYSNLQIAGGLSFDISLKTSSSQPASMYDQKLVDRGDGKYHLTFSLYQKGNYSLVMSEQVTGLNVGAALALQVVTSSVDLDSSVLSGSGLSGAIAGQATTMSFLLKDKFGNIADAEVESKLVTFLFDASAAAVSAPSFTNVSHVGEHVQLSYMVQYPGEYRLLLSHDGTPYTSAQSLDKVKISPQMSPEVVSAVFESTYRKLNMNFDVATDRGFSPVDGQEGSDCGKYLKAEMTSLLGTRPSCIWKDDKQIIITLGYGATLSPGNTLELKDSVIMNAAKNSLHVSGYTAVQVSSEPSPAPSLSVVSSPTVGVCDSIVLDVSASSDQSGRPLTFTYTCESLHQEAFKVVEALSAFADTAQTRISLSNDLFVPGLEYKFGVEAKNFLGISSSASVTVSKQAIPVPNIYVNGGSSKKISVSQSLTVEAYASFPDGSCLSGKSGDSFDGMQESMVFAWSQTGGPTISLANVVSASERQAHTVSLSTRYLYIPSNMLSVGTYTFSISGNVKGSTQFSSTAEVAIEVEASAITVNFAGSSRSVTTGQDLTLRVDAADPDSYPSDFEFSWTCHKTAAGTTQEACPFKKTPIEFYRSSSFLPFSPTVGEFLPEGEYTFKVSVVKEPAQANRVAEKSVVITVVDTTAVAPKLSITGPAAAGKFSPSNQLTLEAIVDPPSYISTLDWTSLSGSLDLDKVALTDTSGEAMLVIDSDKLLGGQDYTFKASVQVGDLAWSASFDVNVNAAPSSGILTVSPATGKEAETMFKVSALNWVDDVVDQPFSYLFYSKDATDPSADWKLLALEQQFGSLNFILPAGTYSVKAAISDVHGAVTEIVSAGQIVVDGTEFASSASSSRRRLLQSSNVTDASNFVTNVRGYIDLGELTIAQQSIDIYKQRYVTATNDRVSQTCFGISGMSVPHGEIMAILETIRSSKPFSEPLFQHQMCSYAELSRDIPAVSSQNAITLYTAVARLQNAALGSSGVTLTDPSSSCMAEAVSNLALVLDAQCESQPPQLRAEVFRLLDLMHQILGSQLAANTPPSVLQTTSFTASLQKYSRPAGTQTYATALGDYSSLGGSYANVTTEFAAAAMQHSMVLTQVHVPSLVDNIKDRNRLVSDLYLLHYESGMQSIADVSTIGVRASKTANLQLQLQEMYPTVRLWNGNSWVEGSVEGSPNGLFQGTWVAGAKPTDSSVLNANSLDVSSKHSVELGSLYSSTYTLHYKMLAFGAYMVDTPKPPPPPPPPPPPSPPPPSPPPPPPPVLKEDDEVVLGLSLEIVIGVSAGIFVVIATTVFCCCCKKKKRRQRILHSAADDDTDIEDEDVPEVERGASGAGSPYGQLQVLSRDEDESQYTSSHFNPFASNQVRLPFAHSSGENKTLRDMLLSNRS
ncbi:hypothetical protein HOP50_09g57140 [Chloropicon primus]|nr:hypothetical protein HOP50_09g57140 [Chloropicon primus]